MTGDTDAAGRTAVDDAPTVADSPGARRLSELDAEATSATRAVPGSSSPTRGPASDLATIASPVDAMRRDEIARMRIFALLMLGLSCLGLVMLPLLGGHATAKAVFAGAIGMVILAYLYLLYALRRPQRFDDNVIGIVAQVCCLSATGVLVFFGVFGPASMVLAIGLYAYSLGSSLAWSLAAYVSLAAQHLGLFVLVHRGVVGDVGLVRGDHIGTRDQILIMFCVQAVYLMAFAIGRASRAKTLDAIVQLGDAVKQIAMREALLAEARQELDRAAWVEGPGRFTDQRIGSYRLGHVIGRGAMGEIYEAQDSESGAQVAVKLLHRDVLADPKHRERFEREANAAASLDVPNVVRVLEVAGPDAPVPYIAMERLRGEDLAHHLRQRRQLPLNEVITIVSQLAAGLEAARASGIVHRDLKPQNVFGDESGGDRVWKILDFGVSKLPGHTGTLTKDNVIGTPAYMAPEQARGRTVDHRADVYGLAAIAYRGLTGRPPFSGSDIPVLLFNVVHAMPERPSELAGTPGDVDLVLAIGMAKKPADRFETAPELAAALIAAARDDLSAPLRARAEKLIRALPWGTSAGG